MVELTVEIPTYNERDNLPILVNKLQNLGLDLEIVIIDDNSPDRTYEVADELSHQYPNVKVIKRPGKMGLASAIADGLKRM